MPDAVSFLTHKLELAAERMGKACRMNALINAAHIAAVNNCPAREKHCLQEAQKLYEELTDARPQ